MSDADTWVAKITSDANAWGTRSRGIICAKGMSPVPFPCNSLLIFIVLSHMIDAFVSMTLARRVPFFFYQIA